MLPEINNKVRHFGLLACWLIDWLVGYHSPLKLKKTLQFPVIYCNVSEAIYGQSQCHYDFFSVCRVSLVV